MGDATIIYPRYFRQLWAKGFRITMEEYEILKDTVIGEDFKRKQYLPTMDAILEYMFHMEQCKSCETYPEYGKYPESIINEELYAVKAMLNIYNRTYADEQTV